MKLKLTEEGFAEVKDGMPVYVHDDGKEIPFDAEGTVSRIARLNAEAANHRKHKEEAEAKLSMFSGIDDPTAALKALETVRNIDDKQLVEAGKVEEVRAAAIRTMEERLAAAEKSHSAVLGDRESLIATLRGQLDSTIIGGAFQSSQFIKDKLAIPADFAEAKFRNHFVIEDGKLAAYFDDKRQERIYSRQRAGDPNVGFDEALEQLVERYPQKDSILRGTNASGSGAQGSSGVMAALNKPAKEMSAEEKAAFIGKHGLGKWSEKLRAEAA